MDNNKETLQYLSKRLFYRKKFDLILRAYSTLGLLIAIFAGAYFLLTLLPYDLDREQQLALMISGVGIALALLSRTMIVLRREREEEEISRLKEYEKVAAFLDTWSQFERVSKEALSKDNEVFSKHSLRSVITRLYEEDKINKADVLALEEALQTRNLIVHGERPWSSELTGKVTDVLVEIIRKIV